MDTRSFMPYGSQLQGLSHKHSLWRAWWRLRVDFQERLLLQRGAREQEPGHQQPPSPRLAGAGRGLRVGSCLWEGAASVPHLRNSESGIP